MIHLRILSPVDVKRGIHDPVDESTLAGAKSIVDAVRRGGEVALREYAEKFDGLAPGASLIAGRPELEAAFHGLPIHEQEVLRRTADRIAAFAKAQRDSVRSFEFSIPGGIAAQEISPVAVAGCYAPGGRYPLPSTVLMTAVTARAAGVATVLVASPRPAPVTLAAAHVANADGVLRVGGAQAIAALAFGAGPIPAASVIVGPGNRWVTAAKHLVSGYVGIDMLAGPSELVVLADSSARPDVVAADLLAQAEHDDDALPILATDSAQLIAAVDAELDRQLATLPTGVTASAALRNGFAVLCKDLTEACSVVNELAPEHLEVMVRDEVAIRPHLHNFGGGFFGEAAAEVFGDYGAGPNHTLPTGGRARYTGGLSIFHFLRIRTTLRIHDAAAARPIVEDAISLARMEGLEGHARSAELRLPGS